MKVDKDKISTWLRFKESSCRTCIGTCCTMPVEVKQQDLINLGYPTELKTLKKQGVVRSYRESTGLFMLEQRPNGDCFLLHPTTRLCTVYDKRPNVCRSFPTVMGNRLGFCPKIDKPNSGT